MKDLEGTPGSTTRVDLAFIGSGEQFYFLLLQRRPLATTSSNHLPHVLHHIVISFGLLSDLGQLHGLHPLPTHYIFMLCKCERRQEQDRLQQALLLLEELLDKERQAHLQELRALNLTVQEIAAEKDGQLARYEQAIAKMGKKVEQYKDRNARLAEKVKMQADTIKALMDRQLSLECEVVRGREELEKERTRRTEEGRYTSELRQVVSLQELQNKQLGGQNQVLSEEITYLQQQLASYAELRGKFANIEDISEQQYQKEMNLLKTSLEHEFSRNTDELFTYIGRRDEQESLKVTREGIPETGKGSAQAEELKMLANFADYGKTYFQLEDETLTLSESKKVFRFIANITADLRHAENQLQKERMVSSELASDLREKMTELEGELRSLGDRQVVSVQTQTSDSGRFSELASMNNCLRLKNYQLLKVVAFMTRFTIYSVNCALTHSTKQPYYHFTEALAYRSVRPKRKSLRQYAFAVVFLQVLSKGARRTRRMAREQRFERDNLAKYVQSSRLVSLLHRFSVWEKGRIEARNHKIDELAQQRADANPMQKIIEILNQETLNQGSLAQNYSAVFTRFILEAQLRP